jgi:hypothetical protein
MTVIGTHSTPGAAAQARYRERHPGRVAEAKRKAWPQRLAYHRRRRANLSIWGKVAIVQIRARAKKDGREFTITADDIVVPMLYPLTPKATSPILTAC